MNAGLVITQCPFFALTCIANIRSQRTCAALEIDVLDAITYIVIYIDDSEESADQVMEIRARW